MFSLISALVPTMEDEAIMKNMKEVLRKTRKAKHKKSRAAKSKNESDTNEDSISEILSKKWMFSSPPAEDATSPKINAFERMMSKKAEPLAQISPEINGIKKKRKNTTKPKRNKNDADNDKVVDELAPNENDEVQKTNVSLANGMQRFLNGSNSAEAEPGEKKPVVDETITRKRGRNTDTPTLATDSNSSKKRKTKEAKMLLDSNENSIEAPIAETASYRESRPRRSCAGKVNYELLISPDKHLSPDKKESNKKRSIRSKPTKADSDDSMETLVVLDDDLSTPAKSKRPTKLAPLFVKKVPKPAIDPALIEARRNFLLSGLPEDLRNTIDRQKQLDDEILSNDLIAFPLISHVTQLKNESSQVNSDLISSRVKLIKFDDDLEEDAKVQDLSLGQFTDYNADDLVPAVCDSISPVERKPFDDIKAIVKQIKIDFQDFPTYRCYKQLHHKYQSANVQESDSDYMSEIENAVNDENSLFVEIFKPLKFDEFLFQPNPARELRKFLLTWSDRDKGDDYYSDDSGSRHSSRGLNNFAVLSGHNGTGKTASVYALANDQNYQVIEINAGSRRSGKKMLQDLLEATQSHRVKNKSGKLYSTQDESDNSQESNCDASNGAKSIILIEDAELAFESDDGFVSSLQQLINISKRPVILTTNNRSCPHLQKFIQHNEIMYDCPSSANQICKYLSLLCLAANYQINAVTIEHLYALNGHDLRKTINEIEFFIRSGNSRTNDGNLMEFYRRPRRAWLNGGQLNYTNKSLSTVCFESSIVSGCAALSVERANREEISYQQRDLMHEMTEFLIGERCNLAENQRDLAHGKQKIIER